MAGFLALPACGFTPVYAPGSAGAVLGQIDIAAPTNGDEFDLVGRLVERLGPTGTPAWRLEYQVSTDAEAFANSGATRRQLSGTASWKLTPLDGGAPLAGKVRALAGYTEMLSTATDTGARLSNDAARIDARRRLMVMLADRIAEAVVAGLAAGRP